MDCTRLEGSDAYGDRLRARHGALPTHARHLNTGHADGIGTNFELENGGSDMAGADGDFGLIETKRAGVKCSLLWFVRRLDGCSAIVVASAGIICSTGSRSTQERRQIAS
jgi:hypothetical protein